MALPEEDRWLPPPGQDSIATRAISADLDPSIFVSCAKATVQEPRLKVITAHYDLAQADNRLLIEWLLRCRQASRSTLRHTVIDLLFGKLFRLDDVRYKLADLLHSDAVRNAYDLVIIDCPPRLTTGMVQALCAASHLLVPTILDRPSIEAVPQLLSQVETLKKRDICPHLQYLGVIASKYRGGLRAENAAEQRLADMLRDHAFNTGLLPPDTFIPQTTVLVREADAGIAYFVLGTNQQEVQARDAIAALATYVAQHMGIPPAHAFGAVGGEKS
jgi:chromosome partitioning protein